MQQIIYAPRSSACNVSMRTLGNLRQMGRDTTAGRPGNWDNWLRGEVGEVRKSLCVLLYLLTLLQF